MSSNFLSDNCWRENKNRYLFSFLSALVELDVFEEISVNFLIVGHTGNEVDQLFRDAFRKCILHRKSSKTFNLVSLGNYNC